MSILNLIGNTPLIELKGLDTGPCQLFVKMESMNPTGSIKDRPALSMIQDAEARGVLKAGGCIVEGTSGNTGIGLAMIAALKGYRSVFVVPDKFSREKISHIRAFGGEVVLTRTDVEKGHPDYYSDKAAALAASIPGGWHANQFANPANAHAHETTTGPEIWEQMEHRVDAIVMGVGSGGTLGGLTNYYKRTAPHVEMVLADPVGSVLAEYVNTGKLPTTTGSYLVEGIGEDYIPPNADFTMMKKAYAIDDKESLLTAREVSRTNGIMGGSSAGTLLAAALRYCRDQTTPKRVVTFLCDSGSKYLSKMYNDFWMMEQGFLPRQQFGDLRDLVSYLYNEKAVVTISPREKLKSAYSRMRSFDVSQVPVMEDGKLVGVVDESDVLTALQQDRNGLDKLIGEVMTTNVRVLAPSEPFTTVLTLLSQGMVAMVGDEQHFYGIIAKVDVIEHLRRQSRP